MTDSPRKISFDVTDIIDYAMDNPRVSGIQRVQIKLIDCLSRAHPNEPIYCFFEHPVDRRIYEAPALNFFADRDFDAHRMLVRLGVRSGGILPLKNDVRHYLRPYDKHKLQRSYKKLALYLTAITRPHRLEKLGFHPALHLHPDEHIRTSIMPPPRSEDLLVYLGANWSYPATKALSRQHILQGGEVVQMVYDLIPYKTPEYCFHSTIDTFCSFLQSATDHATRFLCISDWTRRDLIEYLTTRGRDTMPVATLPLAHELDGYARNETGTSPDDASLLTLTSHPYVLCVGTVEVRKNGMGLLRAWDALGKELGSSLPTLIFAGKRGWKIDEFIHTLEHTPGLSEHVRLVEHPSDKDLAFLYQQCLFTAYPSFYEGWGLPVGEAAWFGKFCVTSSSTSLPEVLGELSDQANPLDVQDLVSRLRRAITDPAYLRSREHAIRSAPLRTWQDVANQLYPQLQP